MNTVIVQVDTGRKLSVVDTIFFYIYMVLVVVSYTSFLSSLRLSLLCAYLTHFFIVSLLFLHLWNVRIMKYRISFSFLDQRQCASNSKTNSIHFIFHLVLSVLFTPVVSFYFTSHSIILPNKSTFIFFDFLILFGKLV